MSLLQFSPVYQERVWGGRALADWLGRELPAEKVIGESWEIVDRPEAQSVVSHGPWAGLTLREVLEQHAAEVMGPRWVPERRFPVLVKWLDCRERLSLQVHPPASVAAELGGEAKSENWYVAHAEPGAAVLAGVKEGVDAALFRAALEAGNAEELVVRHATSTGDSLMIESGVMHAIEGGNVILEIQQNSDTTYRVYDWGRMGLDGRPRQLHVEASLACLSANVAAIPELIRADDAREVLADCQEFRIRRVRLAKGGNLAWPGGEQPRLLSVVTGSLRDDSTGEAVTWGSNALSIFAEPLTLVALEDSIVLVTENFTYDL